MKLFGTMKVSDNVLEIGGVKTDELVNKFGTPLYVMDEKLIRFNCKEFIRNFKCNQGNKVAFAAKSFINLKMINIVEQENLFLDVVSGGELYIANKAKFPMEKIIFHGNNKTIDELELALNSNVGIIVIDSYYEIEMLNSLAKKLNKEQKVYIRISPGIDAHTHQYIKTGQFDSKFGFPNIGNEIIDVVKYVVSKSNLKLMGLHSHIGSQIFDLQPFQDEVLILLSLIKKIKDELNYNIDELDLGGGFAVYYTKDDSPKSIEDYCNTIINKADEVCNKLNIQKPVLIIEPGRAIVANSAITLYTVGAIKEVSNIRKFIAVDGGMNDNIRPALYGAKYECILSNRVNDYSCEKVRIVGKCCESGDILIDEVKLPKCKSGDTLCILSTGAYEYSMASNYNRIPRPAIVMVMDGVANLIVKRESYEDLII